jgi:hypothetical protein
MGWRLQGKERSNAFRVCELTEEADYEAKKVGGVCTALSLIHDRYVRIATNQAMISANQAKNPAVEAEKSANAAVK